MSAASRIGFTLIGGYLGAGKTTLLNRLLRNNESRRIALLINDFGAINIDAALIEKQTDSQINLTNGCVCCGLSDGFDRAIEQLLAQPNKPDHIIVEASGVADVATLSQYGQAPELELDAVLVVADAETVRTKATDKYVAKTVTRQLAAADLIILNKIDLVSATEQTELLSWLSEYLPAEFVVPTSYCDVPLQLLIGAGNAPARFSSTATPQAEAHTHDHAYVSWHFASDLVFSKQQISDFLAALPPTILRGKGWFNVLALPDSTQPAQQRLLWQRVGQRETLSPLAPADTRSHGSAPSTQLVVIAQANELATTELDRIATHFLGEAVQLGDA